MDMNYKDLYKKATEAMEKAYAPYSKFKVGAALLCEGGEVFCGANIENSTYGATICAERVAASRAVFDGQKNFAAIAIASSGGAAWPCGICRQFLYEFSEDMKVITGDDEDSLVVETLSSLLPKGFRL